MDHETFMMEVEKQFLKCKRTLTSKGDLYAPGHDRLEQFKILAKLQNDTPIATLSGLVSKHFSTLVYMMENSVSKDSFKKKQWDETITDIMNYCLLLQGLLTEER